MKKRILAAAALTLSASVFGLSSAFAAPLVGADVDTNDKIAGQLNTTNGNLGKLIGEVRPSDINGAGGTPSGKMQAVPGVFDKTNPNWLKTPAKTTLDTDANGFVVNKDNGKALEGTLSYDSTDGSGGKVTVNGYLKPNADKTDFERGADGKPIVYDDKGAAFTNQGEFQTWNNKGTEALARTSTTPADYFTNSERIEGHDAGIAQNKSDISANKAAQDAVNENQADVNTGLGMNIQKNRDDITSNKAAQDEVNDNQADVNRGLGMNIQKNRDDIGTNKAAIGDIDKLNELTGQNNLTDGVIAVGIVARDNHDKIEETQVSIGDEDFRKTSVQSRLTDMNQRFQTGMEQGKNYVDATAQQTLRSANDYTDSRYNKLNSKMKKLRARADAGIAGATAIGSLAFDTLKPNSIAGGLGVAKNKVAGAIGYQRNFNENWRARATISVSDNYVQGGTSVGYSW